MIKWEKDPFASIANVKGALRRKILRKAIAQAVKILRPQLKAAVPVQSGATKKSIGQKLYTSRRKSVVGVIGARASIAMTYRGRERRPSKYFHIVNRKTHVAEMVFNAHKARVMQLMEQICERELAAAIAAGKA